MLFLCPFRRGTLLGDFFLAYASAAGEWSIDAVTAVGGDDEVSDDESAWWSTVGSVVKLTSEPLDLMSDGDERLWVSGGDGGWVRCIGHGIASGDGWMKSAALNLRERSGAVQVQLPVGGESARTRCVE